MNCREGNEERKKNWQEIRERKKIVTITRKQFDLYFPSTDFTVVILYKHSEV